MAKKRASGEGTLYQLPSGSWRAQVTIDGRRLSATRPTQREARAWLKETSAQIDRGLTWQSANTTLETYLADWLVGIQASKRTNTYNSYRYTVCAHIIPRIGKIHIGSLRPDQVQAMYNDLLKSGGPVTVDIVHRVLHSALEQALKLGLVARNVTEAATRPQVPKRDVKLLTDDELNRLLVVIENHPYKALIYMAIMTGMRKGELFALRWSDLDWLTGEISVTRQVQRSPGGREFIPPKSKSGTRTVAVGDQMIEILREQYEITRQMRIAAGDRWTEHDLMFPSTVGTPLNSRFRDEWIAILERAEIKRDDKRSVRFHDLRHLNASLQLVKLKKSVTEVSASLGHANPTITLNVYGHMLTGMKRQTANEIEGTIIPVRVDSDRTQSHT